MKNIWTNLAAVVAIATVSLTSVPVSAEPAFVLNYGRDGQMCDGPLEAPMVGFEGHASVVINAGGRTNISCNGTILGDAPEKTIVFTDAEGPIPGTTCKGVITKAGRFNAKCTN
jgi:hypothetical protein